MKTKHKTTYMLRNTFTLLLICLFCSGTSTTLCITQTGGLRAQQTFSSQDPAYIDAVTAGETALKAEEYNDCLMYYADAFTIKTTSYLSTLRAAACAHSAGKIALRNKYLDHAFSLDAVGSSDVFKYYEEFAYLYEGPFAQEVEDRFLKAFPDYDRELAAKLAEVRRTDQEQRLLMREYSEKHGWQSSPMDSLWSIQSYSDSVNTVYITNLIDEIGYPGKSIVGDQAATAFLVIQHAELEVQEKYLPVLRAAAEAGELRWASLALLIDRIEMRNGRPQIYGSQVSSNPETGEHFFAPIQDPHNIDSIRQTVGLGPIQQYADNWNFTFDPEKHLSRSLKE